MRLSVCKIDSKYTDNSNPTVQEARKYISWKYDQKSICSPEKAVKNVHVCALSKKIRMFSADVPPIL